MSSATIKRVKKTLSRMLDASEVANDPSAVASISRALLAVEQHDTPAQPAAAPTSETAALLEQATLEERQGLREIIQLSQVWKRAVRARLELPQPPPSVLDRPLVGQPYFAAGGIFRLWELEDEQQIELLREFLGEERLAALAEFLEARHAAAR